MLEDKVQHATQFGATDAPLDAIIELTAKLKQEFQEFKSESDEIKHVLEKVKTIFERENHENKYCLKPNSDFKLRHLSEFHLKFCFFRLVKIKQRNLSEIFKNFGYSD